MSDLSKVNASGKSRWHPKGAWLLLGRGETAVGVVLGVLAIALIIQGVTDSPATDDEPERGIGLLAGLFVGAVAAVTGVPGYFLLRGIRWPQLALVGAGLLALVKWL